MHREVRRQRHVLLIQTGLIFALMLAVLLVSGLQVIGAVGLAVLLGMATFFFVSLTGRSSEIRPANATPVSRARAPEVYAILDDLCRRAEIPGKPEVYLLSASMMNAAALGNRERPIIVVTPLLLQSLSAEEIRGVLAHEVAHLKDNDLMAYRVAEAISMITMVISRVGWLLLILYLPVLLVSDVRIPLGLIAVLLGAPVLSVLLQMALSRSREFAADLGAVELTDQPLALASALEKIDNVGKSMLHQVLPVPKKSESSVFRSHPAISDRVDRLRELARTPG
mgnify:CR=1 FL=1